MIAFFRKNRKGVVGTFIIGMCAILMLPFGVDYFGKNSAAKSYVAKVGKKEISLLEYDRALYQYRGLLKRQFGDSYEKIATMLNTKQKVLDQLIDDAVLEDVFSQAKFEVGISHIEAFIRNLPIFAGQVSREQLTSFLRAQGMTERQFQSEIKKAILRTQVEDLFSLASSYSPKELDERYRRSHQEVTLEYAKVEAPAQSVSVTEEEVKKYYEENKQKFLTEKEFSLKLIKFPLAKYASKVVVHEEDIEDLYRKYEKEFTVPAKAELEQFTLQKKGPDFLSDEQKVPLNLDIVAKAAYDEILAEPTKFKEITSKKGASYNADQTLKEVSTLPKEVQQIIKNLNEGELSNVINLKDSFVIIRLKKYQPELLKPISEVRSILEERVKNELAPDMARVAVEEFKSRLYGLDKTALNNEVTEFSKKENLEVSSSSGVLSKLPVNLANLVGSKAEGDLVVADEANSLTLAWIESVVVPQVKTFDVMKSEVKSLLTVNAIREKSKKLGLEIIASARNAGDMVTYNGFSEISKKYGLKFSESKGALSSLTLPFLPNPDEVKKVTSEVLLRGLVGSPLVGMDGGVYLVVLKESKDASSEVSNKDRKSFLDQEMKEASRRVEDIFLEVLKRHEAVEVNDQLLDSIS